MISTLHREGRRPRARRLLGRLAAVLVVGSLGLGAAPAAVADDADAEQPADAAVEMFLSVGDTGQIAPGAPLPSSVTIENPTDSNLTAGSVSVELNSTPLPDGAALDAWLDGGAVDGAFRAVAVESSPAVADGSDETIDLTVEPAALGELAPGVYPLKARLTGATTTDSAGKTVPLSVTAGSVLVVPAPSDARTAVIVPVTATPENGALLTPDELTTLTSDGGDLAELVDAVSGTSAILAIDPAIPASIRVLGDRAPASATRWLEQFEALPNDMFTLQFGDADATVQAQAGRSELLGTPDLTPLLDPADFPAVEPKLESTSEPTPTPIPTAEPDLPESSELTAVRGAHGGILWPQPTVTEQDLAAFGAYLGDKVTTILPSTSVEGDAAVHSAVDARDLLITDASASARLSAAVEGTDSVAAADSEMAAVAGHLFFAGQRSSLTALALERSETRSPEALRKALVAFASPGATLSALRGGESASVSLAETTAGARVAELNSMMAAADRLTAFASILDEPAVLLVPDRIRMLRVIGAGLSDDEFAERAADHTKRVNTTLASVNVVKPKPVQLFTSAAPLPVWVRNDLPWPVTVTLFSTPSDNRLDIQPATEVTALASSSTRVDIPIEARVASGRVDVRFWLESPTGVPVGQPEVADVTLRADWEGIGLGILGGVIVVLLIVGSVRMVRRRRADARHQADAPHGPAEGEQ
ncbi:hypothetical protein CW368_05675 [Actinomycetales bacterium SN12]|nr:hypothetical protein CW368_05675 [Actinomycetales bacterium SN12]